jgi:hypothetical protein
MRNQPGPSRHSCIAASPVRFYEREPIPGSLRENAENMIAQLRAARYFCDGISGERDLSHIQAGWSSGLSGKLALHFKGAPMRATPRPGPGVREEGASRCVD